MCAYHLHYMCESPALSYSKALPQWWSQRFGMPYQVLVWVGMLSSWIGLDDIQYPSTLIYRNSYSRNVNYFGMLASSPCTVLHQIFWASSEVSRSILLLKLHFSLSLRRTLLCSFMSSHKLHSPYRWWAFLNESTYLARRRGEKQCPPSAAPYTMSLGVSKVACEFIDEWKYRFRILKVALKPSQLLIINSMGLWA